MMIKVQHVLGCDDGIPLADLKKVHDLLSDLAKTVNAAYSVQNLIEVTSSFVNIVINVYLVVAHFLRVGVIWSGESSGAILVRYLPWALMSVWRLVGIVYSSEVVVQEANHTEQLVGKLSLLSPLVGRVHHTALEKFSQQLRCSRLRYHAAGFFLMDRSLLTGCVSAITTYIVILVQFADVNPSSK
ncbi:putative gustatory receptor 28b [Schistocerca serialis cubense]|uniref:putative gustatory receptor 28b n=1 Tax=Schistocerca serialis cubense TaxID=2023355 RepID=UPI00214E8773|nr:putative gustatory receptor 28b [Schistocerca serialis cubense]